MEIFLTVINKLSLIIGTLIIFVSVIFGGVYSFLYFKDIYKMVKKEEKQNEKLREDLLKILEEDSCFVTICFMLYSYLVYFITSLLISFLR